jgi:hypothetical protein
MALFNKMDDLLNIFNDYAPLTAIFPVVFGVLLYKHLSSVGKVFTWIFIFYLIRDILGYIFWKTKISPNFANNTHIFFELPLIYLIFRISGFNNSKIKNFITYIFLGVIVYAFLDVFIIGSFAEHKYNSYAISCLFLIVSGLLYLFDFALFSDLEMGRLPISLFVISSLMIITIVYVVFYILIEFPGITDEEINYIWMIRNILFILYWIFAIIILFKDKARSNE